MDKRLVPFLILSAAVMLLWSFLQPKMPAPVPPKKPDPVPGTTVQPKETGPGFWTEAGDFARQGLTRFTPLAAAPDDGIVLQSPFLRVNLTNRGAGITQMTLVNFPKPGSEEVILLRSIPDQSPNFSLVDKDEAGGLAIAPWAIESRDANAVVFAYRLSSGLLIRKKFAISPDRHVVTMELELTNQRPAGPVTANLECVAVRELPNDGVYRADTYLQGFQGNQSGSLTMVTVAEAKKEPVAKSDAERDFFGVRNRYFTVAILPQSKPHLEQGYRFELEKNSTVANPVLKLTLPMSVTVTNQATHRFLIYGGPIQHHTLDAVSTRLGKLANPGGCMWFVTDYLVPVLLFLMNLIYKLVGNYGVAIILTTLVVRLCLFPLSRKSQIAMAKFAETQKKLKPRLDAINAAYANNPAKLREEQMALFREHGTSMFPFAGCLPILLQLPVFISMYTVFDASLALRHQSFFGWIDDLSLPDQLAHLGGSGPILFFIPYDGYLNLLPIIMTIVWFLQSYFQPKSPDPQMAQQQKMMMFMPILFGLMCYTLASGLSLYFLANSLLSLAEMKIIKKLWIPAADAAAPVKT